MRIYLDNCAFNRPFDNQDHLRIQLETEAKLFIQQLIIQRKMELVWSDILELENQCNPYALRRSAIEKWRHIAISNIRQTESIITAAHEIQTYGVSSKDALHVACAVAANADYLITTDDVLIKKLKKFPETHIISPLEFVERFEYGIEK